MLAALRLDPLNREALEQLYQSEQQLGEQTAFARPLRRSGIQAKSEPSQGGDAKSAPAEEPEEDEESGEEVSFAEATELFRRGDYLAAIDAFGRVLALQPGLREAVEYQKLAYYNQGVAYIAKQSYAEALKMFERLRRIQPDFKRLSHYMQTARPLARSWPINTIWRASAISKSKNSKRRSKSGTKRSRLTRNWRAQGGPRNGPGDC